MVSKNQVRDLRKSIGKEFSDNHSTTLRSVLVSVSECGKFGVTNEVDAYGKKAVRVGEKHPTWLIWNAMFF